MAQAAASATIATDFIMMSDYGSDAQLMMRMPYIIDRERRLCKYFVRPDYFQGYRKRATSNQK